MKTVTVSDFGVCAAYDVYTYGEGSPTIIFTAGIHGNEVTGVYVARRLIEYFNANPPSRGTIKLIPTANTTAMRCMQRRSPFDREDLNRIFPGDENGSLSHRLAASLYAETADADIIVDLHCCGQHGLPYILSVYNEFDTVRTLVKSITMPIAVRSEGTGGQLFTESCRNRGQAACIIELPSGAGSGAVNLPVAEQCFEGLMDMLRANGVIKGDVLGQPPVFYGTLKDAYAPKAGLWRPQAIRGMRIEQGQQIGTVDGEAVCAPQSGMAMGVLPCGYIFTDDLFVMTYIQPE